MPPKAKTRPSSSKDLVTVGPREVFSNAEHKTKAPKTEKPTTSRALILRRSKYGAVGTGEVMLATKMSGREKLDLLAENLLEESKKAIATPFRLEQCLKIAESQSDSYIDDIANLKDPDFFRDAVEAELLARTEPTRTDARRNASHVAKVVATKVHNAYMLASAWKIVSDSLNELAVDGITDLNIKTILQTNSALRTRFLVLHDMVNDLVTMSQDRFSLLATTTAHYAKYFKLKANEGANPNGSEYVFDWKDLRGAANSFLDSIIIELCFPRGTYPKSILYRILHDAIEESPRETKRFPQALWDAVGDLSVSVELQELLSAPLFGPEGQEWKNETRQMPEEYESWVDAQLYSETASNMFTSFKDTIFPLEKTKNKKTLDEMWKLINENYISVSGAGIDVMWGLDESFDYAPQWSSYSGAPLVGSNDDSDDDLPRVPTLKSKTKRLAITSGGDGSDDSMPGLQSVSDTSEEESGDDESDGELSEGGESDDDGYNTEEEDDLRDMLREATEAAIEAEYVDSSDVPPDIDPFLQEDRKGNPFLKLLGSLRGRMFSSNPKLKTQTTRAEPRPAAARGAFRATATGVPKQVPTTLPPKPAPARVVPPTSHKATVEEVEDEDDVSISPQKKKKKKKTKKKRTAEVSSPDIPSASVSSSLQPESKSTLQSPLQPQSPKKSAPAVSRIPASPTSKASLAYMSSTTSLPLGTSSTTGQSAHSYLQSLGMKTEKKVKSRPDHASLFSNTNGKKGFFSKISSALGKDKETEMKEAKRGWFSRLTKKTTGLMHQLLKTSEDETKGQGDMKWESFLKIMREMGFEYDPSTAGSSVRFDPPNKNDRPITFHKPHPDPTLTRIIRRNYAKKLKEYYGWNEEDLLGV